MALEFRMSNKERPTLRAQAANEGPRIPYGCWWEIVPSKTVKGFIGSRWHHANARIDKCSGKPQMSSRES
jgi:hypothetical protein